MERYIAIDNVCAWPNLTQLPDGTIIATIFNQPTHGGWEGDLECWASEDQGLSWKLRGVPAPHEPGTNRMHAAAGTGQDGTLIVLASGFGHRNPPGRYSRPKTDAILPIWVCQSRNGGRSWEWAGSIAPPPGCVAPIIPFGDIVQLADGKLGACLYSWESSKEQSALFYTSSDGGRTWAVQGTIREGNLNETTPLVLPDGKLLALARTTGDQHLELFASCDGGSSWSDSGRVTLGLQHPGHLLRLKDGRILMSYGIRNTGFCAIGACFSLDEGVTWEPPFVLVHFELDVDCGYPSSVETRDGTIVTAYYCEGIPAHHRYHMGVVRWKPGK